MQIQNQSSPSGRSHIGIIACSADGASLCYRTLCVEGATLFGKHSHPEVSLHGFCLADYMLFLDNQDWQGVGQLMLSSAQKLATLGADFLICPDNTIHQALPLIQNDSPLPWLHIARVVAEEAKHQGYKQLGVLGTKYLMEGPVYAEILADLCIKCVIPHENQRSKINQIIFDELNNNVFRDSSKQYFYKVIDQLKQHGCDAVVLGCTEIPLLVIPTEAPLPVLDSTRLLARAALQKAWKKQPAIV